MSIVYLARWFDYNSSGSNLSRNFHILQKLTFTRSTCGHSLGRALCQASSDIRVIVSSITSSPNASIVPKSNVTTRRQEQTLSKTRDLREKLEPIACLFPCLINAMNKLTGGAQGAIVQPCVIHALIKLLRDLLDRLLTLAAENRESLFHGEDQRWSKSATFFSTSTQDDTVLIICQLILKFLALLDFNRATDQKVLNGFLYFLLGRIGATLKNFVFGHDSNNILYPNTESQVKVALSNFDEERKTAEAQAPYLIFVLERIAPFTKDYRKHAAREFAQNPQSLLPLRKTARPFGPASETLQSTLLAAFFCLESSADSEQGLAFPLSKDVDQDSDSALRPDTAESEIVECVADWYKGEVWRVLGWDSLRMDIAWEGVEKC